MDAHHEASAIIAHYLKALAQRAGLRWTPANDHDMRRLGELLTGDQAETIAPYYQATEPARQLDTRVTTVLDREPASRHVADDLDDPNYQRWRQQRQRAQTETTMAEGRCERAIAQRMLDREQR